MRVMQTLVMISGVLATSLALAAAGEVKETAAMSSKPGNWAVTGHGADDTRFSPLSNINANNVKNLRLAWSYDFDTHRGQEATPVVVDGVMYTTSAWSKVQALRADSGKLLWQFDPKVPGEVAAHVCCDVVNRGVAVTTDRVFVGTLDGRLIALNRHNGKLLWSAATGEGKRPYAITGAPLVAGNRVIIGNAGGEFGVRGYVSAYDTRSGKRLWRFYTVPDNPAKPFENDAMRRAATTWTGQWWKDGGGGTVWNSLSYDPQLGLVYFGTGNAAPWSGPLEGGERGDALYTASIMALHIKDGSYAWHYQTTPSDVWDYDADQNLSLTNLKINGQDRKVILQANKNGYFYVLDRTNGQLLSANAFVPVNWSTGIDLKTGRPQVNPEARYDQSGKLFVAQPGGLGAHNWQPMSYSPQTGLVYIPEQQAPFPYLKDKDFKEEPVGLNMGVDLATTSLPQDPNIKAAIIGSLKGALIAWDPVAGREVWRADHPGPWNGGSLATAGDLVFQGTANGEFLAYQASNGQPLWSFAAQTGIIAAPMAYSVNGKQYVTILAGWGGVFPLVGGELAFKSGRLPNRSRILTFALDGTASLPAVEMASVKPLPAPPTEIPAADLVAQGAVTYARYCGGCHGDGAYGGSLLPDLRASAALKDDALWDAIVNKGALKNQGMIAWGDSLGVTRTQAVRAFVISRAQQGYAAQTAAAANH